MTKDAAQTNSLTGQGRRKGEGGIATERRERERMCRQRVGEDKGRGECKVELGSKIYC